MRGVRCRAAVPAMIVSVDCQTCRIEDFDRFAVTADVLATTVGNLDQTTRGTTAVPTKASHLQSVRASKVKLGGRSECSMSELSRHRVLLNVATPVSDML